MEQGQEQGEEQGKEEGRRVGGGGGLKLYRSNEQSLQMYDADGKVYSDDEVMEAYLRYVTMMEDIDSVYADKDGHHQPSLADAVTSLVHSHPEYQSKSVRDLLLMNYLYSQLESLQNASMEWMNAKDYGHGVQYEGGDHVVVNGYHNVALALSQGLDIRLSTPVTAIEYSSPTVRITAGGDTLTCDAVVLSLPIGVVKAATVAYSPPLPAWKVNAWAGIGSGLYNKVILTFRNVFWPKHVDYFGCIFDPAAPPTPSSSSSLPPLLPRLNCWFVNHYPISSSPTLICAVSASYARHLEPLSDSAIVESIMQRVRFMWKGQGVEEPVDAQVTRWGADEWSRGSYSYLAKGGVLGCLEDAGRVVKGEDGQGRLFWCGEHTSVDRFGYADGAYVSGLREADKVLKQYESAVKKAAASCGGREKPIQSRL